MSAETLRDAAMQMRDDVELIEAGSPFLSAVADWLNAVAARYEDLLDTFAPGSRAGAVTAAENVTGWHEAQAAARAYLGGDA